MYICFMHIIRLQLGKLLAYWLPQYTFEKKLNCDGEQKQ